MSTTNMTDTHAHLDGYGDDLDAVLRRASRAGVARVVAVGIDAASTGFGLSLLLRARREADSLPWPELALSAGLHPHYAAAAKRELPVVRAILEEAMAAGLPAAVGETGLDYYRDRSPRADQRAAFWAQVEWAHELRLPLIVHDRDAHDDVLAVLTAAAPLPCGGVLHCFSGGRGLIEAAVALGMHISFAGPVTYANAGDLRELAASVPLDRLLIETDCPYLTPVPHRGRTNEPAYLAQTAGAITVLRAEPAAEVLDAMWRNSAGLFWGGRAPSQPRP